MNIPVGNEEDVRYKGFCRVGCECVLDPFRECYPWYRAEGWKRLIHVIAQQANRAISPPGFEQVVKQGPKPAIKHDSR